MKSKLKTPPWSEWLAKIACISSLLLCCLIIFAWEAPHMQYRKKAARGHLQWSTVENITLGLKNFFMCSLFDCDYITNCKS